LRIDLGRIVEEGRQQAERAASLAADLGESRIRMADAQSRARQLEAELTALRSDYSQRLGELAAAREALERAIAEREVLRGDLVAAKLALGAEQEARLAAEARAAAAETALAAATAAAAVAATAPVAAAPVSPVAAPAPAEVPVKRPSAADNFLAALPTAPAPAPRPVAAPAPVVAAAPAVPPPSPEWLEREKRRLELLARPTSEVPAKLYFQALPWGGLQPSGVMQIQADPAASDPARALGSFAAGAATRQAIDQSRRGSSRPAQ
jgi:hypothetical protein